MSPTRQKILAFALFSTSLGVTTLDAQSGPMILIAQQEPASAEDLNNTRPSLHYIDRMNPVRGYRSEAVFGTVDLAPSRVLAVRGPWGREDLDQRGYGRSGLKLVAEIVPSAEQPLKEPGWAGYYSTLKKGDDYFSAVRFRYLTFWIRGEKGDEKLQVALIDRRSQESGNQNMSGSIEAFTERGAIDSEWQKARIPLDIFQVDLSELYQVVLLVDNKLYDSIKARKVTVYIDDLALE